MRDFLSVELVQGGHVSAKMSLNGGTAVAMVMSDVIKLNNGRWHKVMLKIRSKVPSHNAVPNVYNFNTFCYLLMFF